MGDLEGCAIFVVTKVGEKPKGVFAYQAPFARGAALEVLEPTPYILSFLAVAAADFGLSEAIA